MSGPWWASDDGDVTLWLGDCLDVLREMPADSVDAIVTDPPYGLEFMGKDWDAPWSDPINADAGFSPVAMADGFQRLPRPSFTGSTNPSCLNCGGTRRGRTDGTAIRKVCTCGEPRFPNVRAVEMRAFQAWCEAWAAECLRVLKPGGWLLAFGGTRTSHRLVCGIEDAGFEVRDSVADLTGYDAPGLMWVYGSGFPKSLDVSKAIDKASGAEREVIGDGQPFGRGSMRNRSRVEAGYRPTELNPDGGTAQITAPATEDAARWEGWGTALKPAWEPIVVARKPLTGTVAANVLEYGTGALNIDGCRVAAGQDYADKCASVVGLDSNRNGDAYGEWTGTREDSAHNAGRWPPNVVLGETAAAELDRQSGATVSSSRSRHNTAEAHNRTSSMGRSAADWTTGGHDDSGGASRFFPVFRYEAKAAARERPVIWQSDCDCETVKPCPSQPRDTTGSGSEDGKSSSTSGSGSRPTDAPSRQGMTSTTGMTTSSTMTPPTSSSSPSWSTSESTPGASYGTESGGSPAAYAGNSSQSTLGTGTSPPKDGRSTGDAAHATSGWSSRPRNCGVCGQPWKPKGHCTVKPVDLIAWLVRLVTPPGGLVLDPFAGSGTTAQACIVEGHRAVLIEQDPQSAELIKTRLSKPIQPTLFGGAA